ncbi:MAG: TRAP transporter large permease subunit, partial [Bacteroidota bacterium]
MSLAVLAILLFISIFLLILYGYPVAFTLGGLSLVYALCFLDIADLSLLPNRIMGIMTNYLLLAVPLFIFMGIMLEKSGLAERLLQTMTALFGKLRGGMAISVVIVGALLAASTGIVGATVITMGLISLPPMLKKGYSPELATGTIAASGTLGQIIPPSVVLVLLGSVLGVSVGQLFAAALWPGLILVGGYILYIILFGLLRPAAVPRLSDEDLKAFRDGTEDDQRSFTLRLVYSLVLPLLLILA